MALERARALVRKWAPRFGLGDFRLVVQEKPHDAEDAWAQSYYDLHEMWGVLDIPGDGVFPDELQELLVLHELSHGLLQLAEAGRVGEEQACNRIARLARGDFETKLGNEHLLATVGEEKFFTGDKDKSGAGIDRHAWLPIVTDALPEQERAVINALYFEGLSLREAAAQLGVAHTTVEDRRDKALRRLSRYFAGLEQTPWNTARRIIALKEPEGGAEHEVIYELHHRCGPANALIRTEVGSDDMDLLVFPVGNYGYAMPKGVPFAVTSMNECGACGMTVGCWFVWQAGHSAHPGSIWTPNG